MTIYVIAEPSVPKSVTGRMIDLSPLAEWSGPRQDVRYLVLRGQTPTFAGDGLYHQIRASLEQFDPTKDYLVWAGGDSLGAVMVGIALADMGVKKFRWLRHERSRRPDGTRDPSRGRYVPIEIDLASPATPPSTKWQPPAHWRDMTSERAGETRTIIGAPRPRRNK